MLKEVVTNGKSNGGFMNKLVKLSALSLFLLAPSVFAGTTVCEFNNPDSGTTPGCTEDIIAYGPPNTSILRISKNGVLLVIAWRANGFNHDCSMGLSYGQDDYSLTLLSTANNCARYRIDAE